MVTMVIVVTMVTIVTLRLGYGSSVTVNQITSWCIRLWGITGQAWYQEPMNDGGLTVH